MEDGAEKSELFQKLLEEYEVEELEAQECVEEFLDKLKEKKILVTEEQ